MHSFSLLFIRLCLAYVLFRNSNLFFILSLVLSELGAFEVRFDSQPELPPEPGFANVPVADGPLAAVEGQLLVLQFLVHLARLFASSLGLKEGQNSANLVLADFLHVAKDSSTEENFGVAKSELLGVQFYSGEDSTCSKS